MPQIQTGYDHASGILNASQQGDALAGADRIGGGGLDFGGIVGAVLAERRRKEQAAIAEQRRQEAMRQAEQQRQDRMGADQQQMALRERQRQEAMQRDAPFAQARAAKLLAPRIDNNLSRLIGGPQASHFQDYASRMAGMKAAGVPIFDYTGMKDIVAGNSGASAEAVSQAGNNLRSGTDVQQRARNQAMALGRI